MKVKSKQWDNLSSLDLYFMHKLAFSPLPPPPPVGEQVAQLTNYRKLRLRTYSSPTN